MLDSLQYKETHYEYEIRYLNKQKLLYQNAFDDTSNATRCANFFDEWKDFELCNPAITMIPNIMFSLILLANSQLVNFHLHCTKNLNETFYIELIKTYKKL